MSPFNGKNRSGDQLRTLSEKEIQDKLYGSFRNASGMVRDTGLTSHRETDRGGSHKTANAGHSDDAVRSSSVITKSEIPVSKPEVGNVIGSRYEGLTSDKPAKAHASSIKPMRSVSARPNASQAAGAVKSAAGRLSQLIISFLSGCVRLTAALFRGTIKLFARLLSALDLRKTQVRLALYWVTGGLFLAVLFLGIHVLNLQREAAMKKPARPSAVRSVEREVKISPVVDSSQTEAKRREKVQVGAVSESAGSASVATDVREVAAVGSHVIQIATFATEQDASKLSDRLKESAFSAFVKPLTRSSGKVYYCVFIGRFPDSKSAESKLEEFKRKDIAKDFQDAFVRSI